MQKTEVPVLKENKKFKENPDAKQNKGSDDIRPSSHAAKHPICEKELGENLSSEGNHQQQKADTDVIERGAQVPSPSNSRTWQL